MPTTMPGFLLISGISLIVLSLSSGKLIFKDISLLQFNSNARKKLRIIGVMCVFFASLFYLGNIFYPSMIPIQTLIQPAINAHP